MMYRNDVKELRSALESHVSTINLLWMTQTVGSISVAETDREQMACELEKKIVAQQRLLEDVRNEQSEAKTQLQDHSFALESLRGKADLSLVQLEDQRELIREVQSGVKDTREQTTSILSAATAILSLATSGVMNLRLISDKLSRMIEVCVTFTVEMRESMTELMRLFTSLHAILRRVESSLPVRIFAPIVYFTDALGEIFCLPYQVCRQWDVFNQMLRLLFATRQGKARVEMGHFLIMSSKGGRLLREASWSDSVRQNDHLSMSMVLDNLDAIEGYCPFPSCKASLDRVRIENGGRSCTLCGRWAVISTREEFEMRILPYPYDQDYASESDDDEWWESDTDTDSDSDPDPEVGLQVKG
jgi:hypothetical protein